MNQHIWPIETPRLPVAKLEALLSVTVVGMFNCLWNEMQYVKCGDSVFNCGSQKVKYAPGLISAYAAPQNAIRVVSKLAAFVGISEGIGVNLHCLRRLDMDMIKHHPILLSRVENYGP